MATEIGNKATIGQNMNKTADVKKTADVTSVKKDKKPRAPSIKYTAIRDVEALIENGCSTYAELVAAGVNERVAHLAVRKLKIEGRVQMGFFSVGKVKGVETAPVV